MSADYQLNNSGRFKKGMIPHNKGKKASAEVKKKISEALNRPEVKKKISESKKGAKNPMFGKHPSDETLKKRSNSLKGHKVSDETKKKLSKANKGHMPWNTGKTGVYSKDHLKKISNQKKGKKNPMFGVSRIVPEKEKKEKSVSQKRRMSSMKLLHPKKWEEWKAKISEKRLHQVFPRKDTTPEKYLQKLLDEIGIKYTKHKPILGQPDIFIHPNICVFADGDYWHANPKSYIYKNKKNPGFKSDDVIAKPKDAKYMWANDKKVNDGLKELGYQILRFWHSEIEQNPKKCLQKIIKTIQKS